MIDFIEKKKHRSSFNFLYKNTKIKASQPVKTNLSPKSEAQKSARENKKVGKLLSF